MLRSIAIVGALAFSLQAHAAPASQASIEKTFQLTHLEQAMQVAWGSVEANMRQMSAQMRGNKPATPEQQAVEDRNIQRVMEVMHQEMNWQKMEPLYLKLYQDTYTQEEIDGLNEFYSSPAGQAYLAKMPMLMQRTMQLMQTTMQSIMPRLIQTVQ